MERLTEAERILKYGVIPEEEDGLLAFRREHEVSTQQFFRETFISHTVSACGQARGKAVGHQGADKSVRLKGT